MTSATNHALADHVRVLTAHQLVDQLDSGHPALLGHRGASPFVSSLAGTDDSEARGGRPISRPAQRARTESLLCQSEDACRAVAVGCEDALWASRGVGRG